MNFEAAQGPGFPAAGVNTMRKSTQLVRNIAAVTAALIFFFVGTSAVAQVSASSQTVIANTFGNATGVAIDPLGNLYVSDAVNALVATLQGSNAAPSTLLSGLSSPAQLAFDTAGNLYIANGTSNQVVKVPYQSGALNVNATTNLGTGLGTVTGVAVDLSGNVYIVDATNKQVVKITGTAQTVLTNALTAPKQVAVDRLGNVYIADSGANKVVYLPTGGGAASTVGTGLNAPSGVATDAAGNIYIADTGNGRVVEVLFAAGAPTTTQNVLTTSITAPASLALDSRGGLYIASGASVYRYSFGSIYFGLLPVGATSQTFPVTLTFTAALAPATIKVLTTGITGLDYKDAGSDTCAAGSYIAGNSCVINVTFTPAGVGPRYGAIVLYDVNNKVLARIFLGGGGMGPLMTIDPGTLTQPAPVVSGTPATMLTPRGLTTDAAGDIFIAEYGNNRLLEIPASQATSLTPTANVIASAGAQGVAINGAGDLILAGGSTTVTMYPYENGTWSTADVVTLGSGYSKIRTAKVDVGGNIFYCDNGGSDTLYETQIGATPVSRVLTGSASTCLGVAVDLYGNIAAADGTAGKALYIPVNGATPYETGSGYAGAWGIAFDASGSIWIGSSSTKVLGRIPNEFGTLVGADQVLATVDNIANFDIWLDNPTGTLFTTIATGSTEPDFNIVNRLNTTHAFASAAVGANASASTPFILSNSGDLPPTYTNGGFLSLYDTLDFPAETAISPACNFTLPLNVGFTCDLAYAFAPQSTGARNATIEISSNAPNNAAINFTGTATGTVTGTVTLALALTTPSSGSPAPTQPLAFTATVTPSTATTAATGPLTLSVDGVAISSSLLASNMAVFSVPAGLALGMHTIGITYAGDKNYAPVTTAGTITITVVAASSTVSLVASGTDIAVNQTITLTSSVPTITGLKTPTRTVTFKDTTTNTTLGTGTLNASGIATANVSFTASGPHAIQATYSGDSVYGGSTSSIVTVTVGAYAATTTTMAVSPVQPSGGYTFGTALTAAITVAPQSGSGTPTGGVDLLLDGSAISVGSALSSGKVSVTLSNINAGSHTLIAYYSGDGTYSTSASTGFSFSVVKATTATTISISSTANYASVPVTFTATVSNVNVPTATPSGSVTFYTGKAALGTVALSGNTAAFTTTLLPVGSDSVTAVYLGDSNDVTSTSTAMVDVVTIVPTTLALTASPGILVSGGTSVLTATVTGSPITGSFSGTVSFFLNGSTTAISSPNVSSGGVASYTTTALTAPITSYTATYSGNGVYATSSTPALSIYTTDDSGNGVIATTSLGSGLSSTAGTAVDTSGNLYIADGTKGLVALVAGGAGAQTTVTSSLPTPGGLAVDGTGDLFIANGTAGHVTEIPSVNNALNVSGAKQLGTGLGTLIGVAVDTSGNVYAADATNKQLVKITSATQTVLSSTLLNPQQVAVDSLGDVYVADGTGNRVVYIPAGGTATTVGTGLLNPTGVAVDAYNNVYISDTGNNRVVKIPFTAGAPVTASQSTPIASITTPGQLTIDRHLALYIGQGSSILKWEANAASFGVLTPGLTSPVYTLTVTFPMAITPAAINVLTAGVAGGEYNAVGGTCKAGTAYTAGQSCTVTVSFTPVIAGIRSGAVTFTASTGQPLLTAYLGGVLYAPSFNYDNPAVPLSSGTQITPEIFPPATTGVSAVAGVAVGTLRGIAVDPLGNVYLCDNGNSRILQTNLAGTVSSVLYTGTGCASVALDGAGNLIVDDMGNNRMLLLPNENGAINGNDAIIAASGFSAPRGMTLDGYGNIAVADTTNIRVVVAPIGGATQYVPTFSNLKAPYDAAIDWQGNIAVADSTLAQIAYLPASGSGATVIGPTLCSPYALAMDGSGAVYTTEITETTGKTPTCTVSGAVGEDVLRITPGSTFVDQVNGHAANAEAVALDAQGNVYTVYGANFVVNNRTSLPLTFSSTVGTASAAQEVILTNSGPAPATFTNTAGIFYLDTLDYALATGTTQACTFTGTLAGGAACEFGIVFDPVQAGPRSADFTAAANQVNIASSYVMLEGNYSSTTLPATTATTLALAVTTPPSGKPLPYQALTVTTTLGGGTSTITGEVSLSIDGAFIGIQKAAATLNFSIPAGLAAGLHTAVATYSGDQNNTSAMATLTISAAGPTPSSVTLTVTPLIIAVLTPYNYTNCTLATAAAYLSCTPVTLTATATGTVGGATPTTYVEFFDGSTLLGSPVKLNSAGVATLVYNGSFTQGTHNITAIYIGDTTYAASTSAVVPLSVVYPGDYTLSLTPPSVTITPGQTSTVIITATPAPNSPTGFYNGQIGLTCSGLPTYATCSVSPNTLYLDGTGTPTTGTLTIITQAFFASNTDPHSRSIIQLCMLPCASLMLLLGLGSMRRRKLVRGLFARNLMYVLALAGLFSSLVACGSHAALAPTAGTYNVTISGTGTGGANHSVTMQVTIQ
jgi:sugar lactone lactonase YvrE